MLNLKEPVVAKDPKGYLAIIEDADGVTHFWNKDGSYDGHSKECDSCDGVTVTDAGVSVIN